MPQRSALARLQQFTTLAALALAGWWFAAHAPARPIAAVVGAIAILFSYSLVLGMEFVLLRAVIRGDPAPMPTAAQLLQAWWGETLHGWRVFYWRQPFRWRAQPDFLGGGKRGVVFLHGFVCNRGFWNPWMEALRAQGHPFIAVNLEPVFGSIDDYVAIVDDAVRRMTQATGRPPVLVCHSMGGLAARAWLRAAAQPAAVHHVVTIGTPHHGTWLARFSHLRNGRQMQRAGAWLGQLQRDEMAKARPPFTCWYSNCDNIVFPPSTATLAGADNRLVPGAAHVELAFRPEVMQGSLALLSS